MSEEPGRNDPCPCKSGKKYKKCCGSDLRKHEIVDMIPSLDVATLLERERCREIQRQKQQGLGKPIIATKTSSNAFVAVGNRIIPGSFRTFIDFLWAFLPDVLTREWLATETRKPATTQHPIVAAFQRASAQANRIQRRKGELVSMATTGDLAFLLHLAYSLYLLEHNVAVQSELLRRLRLADQFFGAHYEALVAGMLIRGGFDLKFEDERDVTTKHCELTAVCRSTGKQFSVEAKRRQPKKKNYDVGNQLYSALKKPAGHDRLIFIELNAPIHRSEDELGTILSEVVSSIESREPVLTIKSRNGELLPAPPAYVVITNHPFFGLPDEGFAIWTAAHGFKIPDFKFREQFFPIRAAYHARHRHRHILALLKAINESAEIPSSFDGSPTETAFESPIDPMLIGNSYPITRKDGTKEMARLDHVCVSEEKKAAWGIFKSESGENMLSECTMSDRELLAYHKHKETYFGVHNPRPTSTNNPVDLFEWLLHDYRDNTKENLLALLKGASDIESLCLLQEDELAEIFCERTVLRMLALKGE